MSDPPVLVELCAGSAAVSLRWLHPRAKPPIAYQGGKRAYADAILLAMGLRPGGGQRNGRVVLVERGPWGDAWAFWAAGGIADTVERLRAWASEDPRALWERLRAEPVPADRAARVAAWCVLQFWAFANKTPVPVEGRWRNASFNAAPAYRVAYRDKCIADGREFKAWSAVDLRLPFMIGELRALPDLSRVEVHHSDVRSVEPINGARVYLDPDYNGTTRYRFSLPRADVLTVAQRWRGAGCEVTISEACALPLDGWHAHRLPPPDCRGRAWSKQQSEWLTMSAPPVGVLPFKVPA